MGQYVAGDLQSPAMDYKDLSSAKRYLLYLARNKIVHSQMINYRIGGGCIKTCDKELLRLVGELAQRT